MIVLPACMACAVIFISEAFLKIRETFAGGLRRALVSNESQAGPLAEPGTSSFILLREIGPFGHAFPVLIFGNLLT